MLRIGLKSRTPQEVVLGIDGWLSGESVGLLEREITSRNRESGRLVLDLDGVKFIDEDGLYALKRWSERQIELRGGSPFVRLLLKTYGLD